MEGKYVRLTSHSSIAVLLAIGILSVGFIIWAFFGSVTDREIIRGVVFPSNGTIGVNVPSNGSVKEVFVHKGDMVVQGQSLALIAVDGAYSVLSAPYSGTVLSYIPENGTFNAFEDVVDLLPHGGEQKVYNVTAYANFTSMRFIKQGQEAQITPLNEKRERVGYVRGVIKRVNQYPTTRQEAVLKLQNASLADEIFPYDNSVFEIEISMRRNPDAPDELDWSFPSDEPIDMSVGTFCNIEVVVKSRSIIRYIFENVREKRNSLRK